MGQTLTHGVYLPDEGERNCYNGLASNWRLLDGAIGTIAAHTAALAGKAPLVHTHSKSDITDFPAYGTTAGTICEGNDSRLSDARTPVAHTHTKSDVTDLFNSANTWSGQNTFSNHLYIYGQWKGLYFENPEVTAGVAPSGDKRNYIAFLDSNGYILGNIILNVIDANATWFQTGVSAKDTNDSSQSVYCGTQYRVYGNGEKYFVPATNGDVHLGNSTLKWKTLNGINPGALSLPDFNDPDPINTNTWVTSTPTNNSYTPSEDGWLNVIGSHASSANFSAYIKSGNFYVSTYTALTDIDDNTFKLGLLVPVLAGQTYYIVFKGNLALTVNATFYPAKGNV